MTVAGGLHALLIAAALAAMAACTPAPTPGEGQTLEVFAAASLVDAFEAAGATFTREHPGVSVLFNFGASDQLALQILAGGPADVFASASPAPMQTVVDGGRAQSQAVRVFARNRMVLVTPAFNPAGVTGLSDLARPGLRLVIAAPEVPAGVYAARILRNASADPALGSDFEAAALANVASYEENVRAVLTKVLLGEADAGLVYRTDARAAGSEILSFEIPSAWSVEVEYPIAPIVGGAAPDAAEAFLEYLLSPSGQALLADFGFEPGGPGG